MTSLCLPLPHPNYQKSVFFSMFKIYLSLKYIPVLYFHYNPTIPSNYHLFLSGDFGPPTSLLPPPAIHYPLSSQTEALICKSYHIFSSVQDPSKSSPLSYCKVQDHPQATLFGSCSISDFDFYFLPSFWALCSSHPGLHAVHQPHQTFLASRTCICYSLRLLCLPWDIFMTHVFKTFWSLIKSLTCGAREAFADDLLHLTYYRTYNCSSSVFQLFHFSL